MKRNDAWLFQESGIDPKIKAAREKAERLLPKLKLIPKWAEKRQQKYPSLGKALIIEFAGMPKAGKSTAIETVRHYFSHGPKILVKREGPWSHDKGFKVSTPAEGVSQRTPSVLKSNLADYNTWAGAYAIQELILAQYDRHFDIIVLDRGPWDAGCWLEYVKNSKRDHFGDTAELEIEAMKNFFQLEHWTTQAHVHVVLTVTPEPAKSRETMRRLIDHAGPASDLQLMTDVGRIYSRRFAELQRAKDAGCAKVAGVNAIHIDTSTMDSHEVAVKIIETVFAYVERSLAEPSPVEVQLPPVPRDSTAITPAELWEYLLPHAERFLRPKERSRLKEKLPHLQELARQVPDQALLRIKLGECKFEVPQDEKPLGANVLADHIVQAFQNVIEDLLSE